MSCMLRVTWSRVGGKGSVVATGCSGSASGFLRAVAALGLSSRVSFGMRGWLAVPVWYHLCPKSPATFNPWGFLRRLCCVCPISVGEYRSAGPWWLQKHLVEAAYPHLSQWTPAVNASITPASHACAAACSKAAGWSTMSIPMGEDMWAVLPTLTTPPCKLSTGHWSSTCVRAGPSGGGRSVTPSLMLAA